MLRHRSGSVRRQLVLLCSRRTELRNAAFHDHAVAGGSVLGDELQDVLREFPRHDNLAVRLHLTQSIASVSPFDRFEHPPISETPSTPDDNASIPSPLCGVPVLEELFRKNRDHPKAPNGLLLRMLAHESVLFRGVMEKKRRVSRLSKYMNHQRRLQTADINQKWILALGKLVRSPDFAFVPEQFQSFRLPSGKSVRYAIPSSRDEIVLDSIRLVLDAIYEPRFSSFSFGFRPGGGRQVALRNLRNHIRGMDWYIVIDLTAALQQFRGFEMVKAACQCIQDPHFERLLYKALDIGYINTFGLESETFIAVPKEMGITPVLLNCYLDTFDKWLEMYRNAYSDFRKPHKWPITALFTPPNERMLRFVRCGSSLFVGLRGNEAEAQAVAGDIKTKLRRMQMDTTIASIRVHHASDHKDTSERASFLGYEIGREVLPSDIQTSVAEVTRLQLCPLLYVPTLPLRECFLENGFVSFSKRNTWIPFGNGFILHWPVEHIVRYYDRLTIGLLEYYALADNFQQLNWFVYILKRSCNLTVGRKLKFRSMRKVFAKYGRDLEVKDGDTVVATLPDRKLTVRPIVKDFHPELEQFLRRRRFITRGTRDDEEPLDERTTT